MALKPTLNRISTFDADAGYVIDFSYQGSQPYGNQLTIYDAVSEQLV